MNELPLIALLAKRFTELQASFKNLAKQPGPKGDAGLSVVGKNGPTGPRGPRGYPGKDGERGPRGYPGKDGKDGVDGKDGTDGQDGKPPAHRWIGTRLSFKKPDGKWGREVDLQGKGGVVAVVGGGSNENPTPVAINSYFPAGW